MVGGESAILQGPAIQGATYQWLRGGVAIRSATNNSLNLSPFAPAKAGLYSLRISLPAPAAAPSPTPGPWLVTHKDPTILVYTLSGSAAETTDPSGATAGASETVAPVGGFLILDRENDKTVFVATRTTTIGRVVDRRYSREERHDASIASTGPVPGAGRAKGSRTTVAGALGEQVQEPDSEADPLWIVGDLDLLWWSGNDALVPLARTNAQAAVVAPLLMTGLAGTRIGDPVQIDNVTLTAQLNVVETLKAWNNKSSLSAVENAVIQQLRSQGFKEVGEP